MVDGHWFIGHWLLVIKFKIKIKVKVKVEDGCRDKNIKFQIANIKLKIKRFFNRIT